MSLYALHIANGRTSNIGVFRLMGRLLSGSGVIEPTGFTVSAQGTPDMTVKVSGSTVSDNLVIITTTGDTYHAWNTANTNVTITSNSTGVTRKDHIVAYVDTALTTSTPDNPGALVLIAVKGTGTSAPTDAQVNTDTSSKPWLRLAEITVANGAGSINSGNIADLRIFTRVPASSIKTPLTSGSFSFALNNAAVTGLSTSLVNGSGSGDGVYEVEGAVNMSTLSVPSTAILLESNCWLHGAGNNGSVGYAPMAIISFTYNSITFKGQIAGSWTGGNNFNTTNSRIEGFVRYIA